MSKKPMLLLSLLLTAIAVMLVLVYVQRVRTESDPGELVKVVIAKKALKPGTALEQKLIQFGRVPKKFLHPDAVEGKRSDLDRILGQRIESSVSEGSYLLWSDFGEFRMEKPALSSVINPGERAVAIKASNLNSFNGLLQPNDHVDILGTFMHRKKDKKEKVTLTLLQDVTVLAVGSTIGRQEEEKGSSKKKKRKRKIGTVTVLVSPENAELLVFASGLTEFRLALRNPEDSEIREDLKARSMDSIIEEEKRQETLDKTKEWREKVKQIEVLRVQ